MIGKVLPYILGGICGLLLISVAAIIYARTRKPRIRDKKNLFQLVIGRSNCGLYLTTKNQPQFRDLIIAFLGEHGSDYSLFKLVDYLKKHDPQTRPIAYETVAITVVPVSSMPNLTKK